MRLFFPRSNRCYDNWKIAFFLFPWQSFLGKQIPSLYNPAYLSKLSLKKCSQTDKEFSRKVVIKVYHLPHCDDTSNRVKTHQFFFLFLLPFSICLSGFYLWFNMVYLLKILLIASLNICHPPHPLPPLKYS